MAIQERLEIHNMVDAVVRSRYCQCGVCQQAAEDTTKPRYDEDRILRRLWGKPEPSSLIIRHKKSKKRHKDDGFEEA